MVDTIHKPKSAESIEGWMFADELVWLSQQAAKSASVAEIGSWKGRSTFALLSACAGPMYAVDHFLGSPDEPGHAEARENAGAVRRAFLENCGGFPNLQLFDRESLAVAPLFRDKSLDMVFIDASHRYEDVLADILAWLPKSRRILAGHDYAPREWPGVVAAVHRVASEFGLVIFRAAQSIWYFEVAS